MKYEVFNNVTAVKTGRIKPLKHLAGMYLCTQHAKQLYE